MTQQEKDRIKIMRKDRAYALNKGLATRPDNKHVECLLIKEKGFNACFSCPYNDCIDDKITISDDEREFIETNIHTMVAYVSRQMRERGY